MIKKSFQLFFILLTIELLVSCCDCKESTYSDYTHCAIIVNNIDNSGDNPEISISSPIPKEAFGISVIIERSPEMCNIQQAPSLLFSSACAFSCHCPPEIVFLPLDSVVSITISTLNDLNDDFPANSDVSDLFFVFSGSEFSDIPAFILDSKKEYPYSVPTSEETEFLLMEPANAGIHQFEISLFLSDGRVLSQVTEPVQFI